MIIRRARTQAARDALAAQLVQAEAAGRENPEVIGPWDSLVHPGTVCAQVWHGPPTARRLVSIQVRPTRLLNR